MNKEECVQRGAYFFEQGQKRLKKNRFFITRYFDSQRFVESAELFNKAALNFKAKQEHQQAFDAFILAAENYEKSNEFQEATRNYEQAYRIALSSDDHVNTGSYSSLEQLYKKAAYYWASNNCFQIAAKLAKWSGEQYAKKGKYETSVHMFDQALNWYTTDSPSSYSAREMMNTIAEFHILHLLSNYSAEHPLPDEDSKQIAIAEEHWKKISDLCEDLHALRFDCENKLFRASLCRFILSVAKPNEYKLEYKIDEYLNNVKFARSSSGTLVFELKNVLLHNAALSWSQDLEPFITKWNTHCHPFTNDLCVQKLLSLFERLITYKSLQQDIAEFL